VFEPLTPSPQFSIPNNLQMDRKYESMKLTRKLTECVALKCDMRMSGALPMCPRHWSRLRATHRSFVGRLLGDGLDLSARVAAALVAELPVRDVCAEEVRQNNTWFHTRRHVRETLEEAGDDYRQAVRPWRELIEGLYWTVNENIPADVERPWTPVEIALAMVRTASGVDGWQPLLLPAALDFEEQLSNRARDTGRVASAGR